MYASLWNLRAFIERDFHRVDHLKTAMGVLVHPSYQDELVNGVAVSFDPVTGRDGSYYVNSQVGEDLVTNPDAHSVPEEVLLRGPNSYAILRTSNQVPAGQLLMTAAQLQQLRRHLGVIHTRFKALYKPAAGKPFAMEIEFKITSDNVLAIKQARPWVFGSSSSGSGVRPPIITRPTIVTRPTIITGGGGGGGGPSGPTPSDVDFEWTVKRDIEELDGGNDWPTGLWSDGAVLWVAENGQGADDEVYAYDLSTGERLGEREFELDEANRAPRGLWSDGVTVWVSDSGRDRLFAYDLASGDRQEERELELDGRNADARGLWSGSETVWVLDSGKNALFAYDLASGDLRAEYSLDRSNGDPRGLWADGLTVWVSDHGTKRLFAYRLPARAGPAAEDAEPQDLERVNDEEFGQLSGASNNSPRGIWANDDVMYVADESDDRVYSYNMPDAIDARLASLTLSAVDIGAFSSSTTEYEAVVGEGVTRRRSRPRPCSAARRSPSTRPTTDGDESNGYQVALQDLTEITVTVTSADGSRTRVYRVQLEAPASVVELSPTWNSIVWLGADGVGIADTLGQAGILDKVVAIYRWDAATSVWLPSSPRSAMYPA